MTDIGYAAAFLGGVATVLSPCAAMLLPAFFAYAFTTTTSLVGRTLVFYAGLVTTLLPLGALSGGLGSLLVSQRSWLVPAAAGLVILLGVLQALAVPLPGLARRGGGGDVTGPLAVYTLGLAYGIAGVCSGPILGSILTVAALGGDAVYGAMLLVVYATGMVLPLFVLSLLWTRFDLGSKRWLRPRPVALGRVRTTVGNLVSGELFMLVGVLLLATEGTASLAGILDIGRQQALENSMLSLGRSIPDLAVVGVAAALVLVPLLAVHTRRRDR